MTWGRCPGCGKSSPSCQTIRTHMLTCPEVAALYQTDPDAVLDPTDEYIRHKEEQT